MKFYGLKTCDTCRKALKMLQEKGMQPEVVDVRADGVPPEELARFLTAFGENLINRRSTTWRGLSEAERAGAPADLLAAHPTLMKRPVIEAEGALYLGWGPDVRAALLAEG
ncbi:arsenate reductase family protein [Pseudoruegeria sp. SHC-113]|uniref:arsenate reductase family protein n=1 Tax=Pseudoruegeria sp. SHC-113 TaxID=2855439 RepID=UPI0021BBB699|nr:ArsC/Spx/MgsR family protein [Pseudoruegeria sp. SHC-113]MCT8159767.1 arsenate reductase [Pseudoruegeria sp. SHC-113]